jgi:hypothetical protein
MRIRYFLVERRDGATTVAEFTERHAALAALKDRESHRLPGTEVVLFGGASKEWLMRTHSRFFKSEAELVDGLRSDLAAAERDLARLAPGRP